MRVPRRDRGARLKKVMRLPLPLGPILGVLCLCWATPTLAADKEGAAQWHHDRGTEHYLAGRYEQAIEEFEKAYALAPGPILLFNIAQAHRRNGSTDSAILFYKRFLKASPSAPNRAEVETRIRELEAPPGDVKKDPPLAGVTPPARLATPADVSPSGTCQRV